MKIKDEYCPDFGFELKTQIVESETGFKWKMEIHVLGPDDILPYESEEFKSKQDCIFNLMGRCFDKANDLVKNA